VSAGSKLRDTARRIYDVTMPRLPAELAASIDYARPSLRDSWGGPLNGQRHRQDMVRELVRLLDVDLVVETGTFRGTSSEFFLNVTGRPLKSVESSPRFHAYARRRLSHYPDAHLTLDDSRRYLRQLSQERSITGATTLFYLDAHWHADLPLAEEIRIIANGWTRAAVMIDDFQVPGDPGYKFDDYGPARVLSAECLPREALEGWGEFYPAIPSTEETGSRRGSVVLTSPEVNHLVASAVTLRSAASVV
jgi:predicted O-methyltransferase YrrM